MLFLLQVERLDIFYIAISGGARPVYPFTVYTVNLFFTLPSQISRFLKPVGTRCSKCLPQPTIMDCCHRSVQRELGLYFDGQSSSFSIVRMSSTILMNTLNVFSYFQSRSRSFFSTQFAGKLSKTCSLIRLPFLETDQIMCEEQLYKTLPVRTVESSVCTTQRQCMRQRRFKYSTRATMPGQRSW